MTAKTTTASPLPSIGQDAQEILQQLLRMDTTNPPGNEKPAAQYLGERLREVGYEPEILESAPERANLVCRRRGKGGRGPLLLAAHLDVVEAYEDRWDYPPFSGELAEGCLWGRGAVDMKNMAAMSVAVMRRLAREDVELTRDVIFAAVADEEQGCDLGSKWLVEHHPELVEAEYALGEVGGFSMHLGAGTFYPVQVAEKGLCWIRARVRGEPGHGSMPRSDSAVLKLGRALVRLAETPLPVHPTRYVEGFLERVAARQPSLAQPLLRLLTSPRILPHLLPALPDQSIARGISALLSNTVSPTVLRAGNQVNVIPDTAEVELDGRTLPGQTDADLIGELRAVLGPDVELEITRSAPPIVTDPIETPLYHTIVREVERREPNATVVPYMIPGFTDAKYFTKTGARWYGFSPLRLPKGSGLKFGEMFHGHNERIPVDGLHWGAEVLYSVVAELSVERRHLAEAAARNAPTRAW